MNYVVFGKRTNMRFTSCEEGNVGEEDTFDTMETAEQFKQVCEATFPFEEFVIVDKMGIIT